MNPYENGLDALEGIGRSRPDLVLLDISLPGMDGMEVLERLRRDEKLSGLPVVALTAHAMRGDRDLYLRHGFDGYISKPIVDETILIETIVDLLEKRSCKASALPSATQ